MVVDGLIDDDADTTDGDSLHLCPRMTVNLDGDDRIIDLMEYEGVTIVLVNDEDVCNKETKDDNDDGKRLCSGKEENNKGSNGSIPVEEKGGDAARVG